jgi:hypothetical protein
MLKSGGGIAFAIAAGGGVEYLVFCARSYRALRYGDNR